MCPSSVTAQDADSTWVQNSVQQLQKDNQRLQLTVDRLSRQVDYLSRRLQTVEASAADSAAVISTRVADVRSDLEASSTGLSSRLDGIDSKVTDVDASSQAKSGRALLMAIIGCAALVLALIAVYVVLRKRFSRDDNRLDNLASQAQKAREQQVELDRRLTTVIEHQLSLINASAPTDDHSLALMVANEMARIEQNLRFMDPDAKGVRQLRNRSKAIFDALKKKGYEMPELIGTEYKEGYNMEASVEEDDTLEPGKMIIKRVSRPAVLFNGKMIQSAQVVVAYNPD